MKNYRMPQKMERRMRRLEALVIKAANHIDSAADVIEDLDGDIGGECEDERQFARKLRMEAKRL